MIMLPYGYGITADSNGYAMGKITVDKKGKKNIDKCLLPVKRTELY